MSKQTEAQRILAQWQKCESRIKKLEAANAELERLCDATYVAQGADAYNHACSEMERHQKHREDAGKEVGCTGSLCDGMAWLYDKLNATEAANAELLDALVDVSYTLEKARIWGGMEWKYNPLHPVHYLPARDKARAAIKKHGGK